ncbi:MAG: hypothetical protein K8T90_14470 [Planctomycetes bacterium]|nr:hypothetical protein [Planctomycetota bacterium]
MPYERALERADHASPSDEADDSGRVRPAAGHDSARPDRIGAGLELARSMRAFELDVARRVLLPELLCIVGNLLVG